MMDQLVGKNSWKVYLLVVVVIALIGFLVSCTAAPETAPNEEPPIQPTNWEITGPGQLVFNRYGSYQIDCDVCYLLAQATNTCWDVATDTAVEPNVMLSTLSTGVQQGTFFQYQTETNSIHEMVVFRGLMEMYDRNERYLGRTDKCEPNATLTLVAEQGAQVTLFPD